MKKTLARIIVTAVALVLFCGTAALAQKTYVNGIDPDFPPFAYVGKDGKPAGFDVDSLDWIAAKMGFKVKHQPMEWSGIIPALTAGKIDIIASGMSATAERKKVVNFSLPYYKVTQVLVVKKDSPLTVKEAMSTGKKIGIQRGTTEAKWFEEKAKEAGHDYKLATYESSSISVEDLLIGRIDASAMDETIAADIAREKPVKIIGEFGMEPEVYGYAVRKEDKDLLEMVDKGLKMLMADPKWNELKTKYNVK